MELLEYLLFILINVIFLLIVLYKRIGLLSVFGIVFTLLLLPLSVNSLIINRYVVVDNLGNTHEVIVYANPTLAVMIGIMLIVMHGVALIKLYSGSREYV
jgi:hypothetical protein